MPPSLHTCTFHTCWCLDSFEVLEDFLSFPRVPICKYPRIREVPKHHASFRWVFVEWLSVESKVWGGWSQAWTWDNMELKSECQWDNITLEQLSSFYFMRATSLGQAGPEVQVLAQATLLTSLFLHLVQKAKSAKNRALNENWCPEP